MNAVSHSVSVRIIQIDSTGRWIDGEEAFDLDSFAGYLPNVGDTILEPGVRSDLDRLEPRNRRLWKVVDRIFNARDFPDTVALVVDERPVDDRERTVVA